MDATLLHDAWVLFTAIGGWAVNKLSSKLDDLDKNKADSDQINEAVRGLGAKVNAIERKVDQLGLTSIGRSEFKSDITSLHLRVNDLEQRKADKIKRVDVKMRQENGSSESNVNWRYCCYWWFLNQANF